MKKIKSILFVLMLLSLSYNSFSQMDKASCEEIIKSIDVTSLEKIRFNESGGSSSFDMETIKFTYKEKYLFITDGADSKIAIPYNKIRGIIALKKDGFGYPSLTIYF